MSQKTAEYPIRTKKEIAELKADWEGDPCWDIENTEGFEAHREELKAFSEKHSAEAKERVRKEDEARRVQQRKRWGQEIPDAALDYMNALEERICRIEDTVHLIKPKALYQS